MISLDQISISIIPIIIGIIIPKKLFIEIKNPRLIIKVKINK